MVSHAPMTEEVVAIDCLYGECEHDLDAGDCPPTAMVVCETCRGSSEDGDLDLFVRWPCDKAGNP